MLTGNRAIPPSQYTTSSTASAHAIGATALWRRFPRWAFLYLLLLLAPLANAQGLREQIDSTMSGQLSAGERQATLDGVFEALEDAPQMDLALLGQAYAARGYAYLEAGRLEDGLASVNTGLERIPASEAPDQHVLLRTVGASLLLASGKTERAVTEYEALLATLPAGLDPVVDLRARANYATALFEAGRVLGASESLRELIPVAESLGEDRMAVILANNLLVILLQRGLYDDALAWLQRLAPLRELPLDEALLGSIRLHELELQRIFGDAQGAAEGLRDFVRNGPRDNASVIGNAFEYLGDAERELGNLEAAQTAGRRAIELLQKVPWELAEAHISLSRTLLAMDRPVEAETVLDEIFETAQLSQARKSTITSVRLEAHLAQAGLDEAATQLHQLLAALEEDRQLYALDYIGYYDARLEAQRQESEIARMREAEALLAVEAEAAEARASELEIRQAALRDHRNLVIALLLLSSSGLIVILYGINRREYQRKLLAGEQQRNRELSAAVEEQAAQLRQQLLEQTEMERALNEKKQTELIGQIAGNVAHDFNNLLQVIYSANETAKRHLTDAHAHARDVLQASDKSVEYARSMTRQLLAYARQQELIARPVDVATLLRDSHTLFRSAVGEKISIEFELPEQAVAMLDASKFTTAVLNLLRNAADAMPSGGKARVSVHQRTVSTTGDEQWPTLSPGDYVLLRVSDEGAGMDEATLQKACEPFYSTKSEHAGTGLGLSSVYGFVRQTGGDLCIESTPSVGTTISLALPAEHAQVVPAPSAPQEFSPHGARRRVLVVEDNDLVAHSLCAVLKSLNATVVHLTSADEAIAHLEEGSAYDYVLSDVRMPGEHDGYDLARWLSTHRPEVPTILMTGFNDRLDEEANYRMINKPFSRAELQNALRPAELSTSP